MKQRATTILAVPLALAVLVPAGIMHPDAAQAQAEVLLLRGAAQLKSLPVRMDPLAMVRRQLAVVVQHLQAEKLNPAALRAAADSLRLQALAGVLGAAGNDGPHAELRAEVDRAIAGARARLEANGKPLAETPQWERLGKTLDAAAKLAGLDGKPRRPDDKAAKAMLAELAVRMQEVTGLGAARIVTEPECQLLKRRLARLAIGVRAAAFVEDRATVLPYGSAHDSLLRLIDRVALLRAMGQSATLHAAAVEKILPTIEADLEVLADRRRTSKLAPDERRTAAAVCKAARVAIDKIKSRIKSPSAAVAVS